MTLTHIITNIMTHKTYIPIHTQNDAKCTMIHTRTMTHTMTQTMTHSLTHNYTESTHARS